MADLTFKANLLPNTDLGKALGSENQRWNIYGELNGNASSADKWKNARTLTIGGTSKDFDGSANVSWTHAEIGATVSNTWTAGTTAGPTIKTTVNGVTGTAVAIPSASASASGVITTGAQTLAGLKIFKNDNGAIMTSKVGVTRGTVPSANQYSGLYFLDSTGQHAHSGGGRIAIVESYYGTNGTTGLQLCTYPNTAGSTATNYIGMYSTQDGTASYSVRDPAAFRTAIGAAASDHSHNSIKDRTNNTLTYSNYGAAGLAASAITWLTCWNGYELRAISKAEMANAVDSSHKWVRLSGDTMTGNLLRTADSVGSSWVGSRDKAVVGINASDSSSSVAYSLCRIKFPSKTFAISSERANPQFGIYGWNNSRTENGYDWAFYLADNGYFYASTRIYGAVWNDYAEKRNVPEAQKTDWKDEECAAHPYAGRCVREIGDDTMAFSTERLQKGCKIISDTFGYCVGETDDCKTPIAVSGRALVYLLEDRETAKEHIGDFVCSGPNGTVSIMTTEEYFKCPQAVVGTISAIPDYEEWGTGHVKVDGRIWIYVR